MTTPSIIVASNSTHLRELIEYEMGTHGNSCDLNHLDVSGISDFSGMFSHTSFCGDVSKWNVANATQMESMFYWCRDFNCDISGWDVSNVENMKEMFFSCQVFNQDLSRWDVGRVRKMSYMFCGSGFAGDISRWPVPSNTRMEHMLSEKGLLAQSISPWVVELYLAGDIQPKDKMWQQAFAEVSNLATVLELPVREHAGAIVDKYKQLMGLGPIVDSIDGCVFSTLQF